MLASYLTFRLVVGLALVKAEAPASSLSSHATAPLGAITTLTSIVLPALLVIGTVIDYICMYG